MWSTYLSETHVWNKFAGRVFHGADASVQDGESMDIQNAKKEDAKYLAFLINLAGEGIPHYLWSGMTRSGETPSDIGIQRAGREDGGFSYTNARVVKEGADVVGMLLSYRLDDPYIIDNLDDIPEVVRPLVVLESKAPGTWYVNAVATLASHRGQGIATGLLKDAEAKAIVHGVTRMSLIVASENQLARGLYSGLGYETRETLPVVDYPGCLHGGSWELMVKELSAA